MQIYLWLGSLDPSVWLKCWVSANFVCFSISRKELGSTTTQSSRFKKEKIKHALQIVANNQAIVPSMKKSAFISNNFSVNMILYWLEKSL